MDKEMKAYRQETTTRRGAQHFPLPLLCATGVTCCRNHSKPLCYRGFVLGRGGPLGGNGHHPHEVVPAAQATSFHHIGRVLSCSRPRIGPALNLSHFRAGGDASPMRGKVWAKGIGHQNQTIIGTDHSSLQQRRIDWQTGSGSTQLSGKTDCYFFQ